MITSDLWFLLVHVLAAAWVATGAFGGALVRARTRRAASPAEAAFGHALAWRLTTVFTLPGLLFAGLLGIHLVTARGYGFGDRWVWISMLVWLVLLLLSLAVLVPAQRRAARSGGSAGSSRLAGVVEHVNALGVVVLILLMVLKPV